MLYLGALLGCTVTSTVARLLHILAHILVHRAALFAVLSLALLGLHGVAALRVAVRTTDVCHREALLGLAGLDHGGADLLGLVLALELLDGHALRLGGLLTDHVVDGGADLLLAGRAVGLGDGHRGLRALLDLHLPANACAYLAE